MVENKSARVSRVQSADDCDSGTHIHVKMGTAREMTTPVMLVT